jgi:riboflavin biosynthesis pyrimidine reductase
LAYDWFTRFAEFEARKTRLATTAVLPPYLTAFENPQTDATSVGNTWSERLFDGRFYLSPAAIPERPACSLVFVQSSDGNTRTPDPWRLGGGNTDKHVVYEGLSRVAADAVLAGAGTVRGRDVVFSVWHPELIQLRLSLGLPRHPIQIVATLRGLELEETLLANLPDIPVVLLSGPSAAAQMRRAVEARPWITVLLMDNPERLPWTFARLQSMGIRRVSCVGGRTLAGHLLEAKLIDDVYLTTGRNMGGDAGTPIFSAPWRGATIVRKGGTGVEQGVVFEHLVPSDRRF